MSPSATSTTSAEVQFGTVPNPDWKFGDGSNHLDAASPSSSNPNDKAKDHTLIDPFAEDRTPPLNYGLLISAITPRPIAFISTLSPDGKMANLAPFSYFNMITHDPPTFVVGFAHASTGPRDSYINVRDSKECVINIISEHYIEAANSASIDTPYGTSEWNVAGLTADYSCETVKPPRVKEAIFSIEAKLDSIKEIQSRSRPGRASAWLAVLEGTRFWVRNDALSEKKDYVSPEVLRPMARMGGFLYSKTRELLEMPRPQFEVDLGGAEGYKKLSNGGE
ncbi:flavo oxygenase [Trichoderma arundinaceum]|uniref:Flavo oxygenase n=1 Tax=Trichoderma arundinaceum TaxID=490622 RepID=A0A395NT25_TRIAR|nr:flavo oxygenase [Trichoderma arundinaceum]